MGATWPGRRQADQHLPRGEKRKAITEDEVEELTPKKRKIQATSSYIYETLFKKGVNHDITICALGKEWKLHRIYLCQSGYFSSMFSGSWAESHLNTITIDIPDANITQESLELAFESLYRDDVLLTESQLPSTVAAASMLQLDGLLEHCVEVMKETLKADNVIPYLNAASMYGLQEAEQECKAWLKTKLLTHFTAGLLADASAELLTELLSSAELFVMQVEMDVYTLAKKWLFLACNPGWVGDLAKLGSDADHYFKTEGAGVAFLDTPKGLPFVGVFRCLRLQHVIKDLASVSILESDRVIPESWLQPLYRQEWLRMLMVDQRLDMGPLSITPEEFDSSALRCGRVLVEPGEYCWRWTGFSYGFDVLISFSWESGLLSVKRNTKSQPCLSAVSLQQRRPLLIRLRVATFDSKERLQIKQDTGIVRLNLVQDEEHGLITVDSSATFPLYISVNMLVVSVIDQAFAT